MSLRIAGFLLRAGWRRSPAAAVLKRCAIPLFLLLCGAPASAVEVEEVSARLFHLQLSLAEKGDRVAQYYVAEMYEKGLGTERDMGRAFDWYGKSADQDYAPAKLRITAWKKDSTNADSPPQAPAVESAPAPETPPAEADKANKPRPPVPRRPPAKTDKPASKARVKRPAMPADKPQSNTAAARTPEPAPPGAGAPVARSVQPAPPAVVVPAPPVAKPGATVAPTAAAPVVAKPAAIAPAATTPVVAEMASQPPAATENAAPAPGSDATAAAAEEPTPFTANPCKGPSARFLSHCR